MASKDTDAADAAVDVEDDAAANAAVDDVAVDAADDATVLLFMIMMVKHNQLRLFSSDHTDQIHVLYWCCCY